MSKKNVKKSADAPDSFQMKMNFSKSNVVSLCGAISRKAEEKSSLEKNALKAVLERASKLNW